MFTVKPYRFWSSWSPPLANRVRWDALHCAALVLTSFIWSFWKTLITIAFKFTIDIYRYTTNKPFSVVFTSGTRDNQCLGDLWFGCYGNTTLLWKLVQYTSHNYLYFVFDNFTNCKSLDGVIKTREIRYRATATFRRLQIKHYTASNKGGGGGGGYKTNGNILDFW